MGEPNQKRSGILIYIFLEQEECLNYWAGHQSRVSSSFPVLNTASCPMHICTERMLFVPCKSTTEYLTKNDL